MPEIEAALIATAQAGNVSAIALAYKLHEAFETGRWELIQQALEAADFHLEAEDGDLPAILAALLRDGTTGDPDE